MGNPLPSSGLDMPCAMRTFTGIPAVTSKPASSVYSRTPLTPLRRAVMGTHQSGLNEVVVLMKHLIILNNKAGSGQNCP